MKQSGRVSLVGLLGIFAVIVILVLFLFSKESLGSIGGRFMQALANGDVETLTKMSYMGDTPEDKVRDEWKFATQVAGLHYRFVYRVTGFVQADENRGSVRIGITRNADQGGGYEENSALPMVKDAKSGLWKVDVRAINREMYPGLPR